MTRCYLTASSTLSPTGIIFPCSNNLETTPVEWLACHEDCITTTLPRPETSGNRKKGRYVKADFAYDAAADVYRCPAGEVLTYRYTTEERGLVLRRYWTNACQRCPFKARCTTGQQRRITRWEHEHLVAE